MSAPLYGRAAPNAEAFVRAWLVPIAVDATAVGSIRWGAGMVLPYRAVKRIGGGGDLITDRPVVRVHTFAATYTDAAREADNTHRRMLILADNPLADVAIGAGLIANGQLDDYVAPHEESYGAETVVKRFISDYTLSLRFVPVPT